MEKTIMRKHIILAAVAALGALVCSCEKEKDTEILPAQNNKEVSLVLAGVATRSAELAPRVYNYPAGEIEEGVKLTLEEVVTEMGDLVDEGPLTRGTPAYTENVQDVHGNSFKGVVYNASGEVAGDGTFNAFQLSSKYCFRREFGFDLWQKAGGGDVTFFLRMPSEQTGVSYLAYDYNEGSIAFNYETPATATEQQDILFASRKIDEATYKAEYKNGGANVLFRHALTGVKFAIGNNTTQAGARRPDDEIQTFITKVEIVGLKDKGHAKFIAAGTETTEDDITEHSSAGSFKWTDSSLNPTRTTVYSQTYGEDDIQDFASGDAVGAPDSFYAGGANRNLNKADGSLTFWFIPQKITSDLIVTVTVKVWHGAEAGQDGVMSTEKVIKLKLGDLIKENATNNEWKAGQLRTFTLKPNIVNVDIDDDVDGFIKKDVVITNTGNVNAYIRANISANWWGTTVDNVDGIALGYTTPERTAFLTPWMMNADLSGDNYDGVFDTLPGANWVYAKDGYFYYTEPVEPGKETGTKLFKTYTNTDDNVPAIYYLSSNGVKAFKNVRLVMDITVQAIEAKANVDWDDAWGDEKVLGAKPVAAN